MTASWERKDCKCPACGRSIRATVHGTLPKHNSLGAFGLNVPFPCVASGRSWDVPLTNEERIEAKIVEASHAERVHRSEIEAYQSGLAHHLKKLETAKAYGEAARRELDAFREANQDKKP